ncbi:MAG: Tfp pilus assembly protein FimT/FimU [Phycisphaerales bacterium JB039]
MWRARAGMTLVELMIALALLVAVASLALPNMFAILARSASAEGQRQAAGALAAARAEAMGRGRPMRITAAPTDRGWQIRATEVAPPAVDAFAESEAPAAPIVLGLLPAQWRVLEPAEAVAGSDFDQIEALEPVELATFLPDGGALAPQPPPTLAAGSQLFQVRLDRWSGRATIEPLRPRDTLDEEPAEAPAADPGEPEQGQAP